MIFAHGPLGFTLAWLTKPLWKTSPTKRFAFWMYVVGFIGGAAPDLDLLYYYLIDASTSHREMITHTPFLYIVTYLIIGTVLLSLKKKKAFLGFSIFIAGTISHLLTDGIVSQIRYFYPLSNEFYGIADLGNQLINDNLLYINVLVEGIFITLFLYLLIVLYTKSDKARMILTTILMLTFSAGVVGATVVNQHVYTPSFEELYGDPDQDDVHSYQDRDIDGDGLLNIEDDDSDGDGLLNLQELVVNAEEFDNVWFDPTNGGLIQIPARLGFVTNDDIVFKLYGSFGIHLSLEMAHDFETNPAGYVLPPTDPNFDRNTVNLRNWFEHTERLTTAHTVERPLFGDVLFYKSGHVVVVTGVDNTGNIQVLDAHKERGVSERALNDVSIDEGDLEFIGQLLDPTPHQQ